MQLPVYSLSGEVVRQIEVSDKVFAVPFNEAAVHQIMVSMQANARQGTSSTKTRSMVSGSTKKLFRQKGTGEARAGSIKSALRRGGGITFGPHPRDYRQDTNKKMRRLAIRCVLSAKAGGGELKVLDGFNFEEPKTKKMIEVLAALGINNSTLVVTQASEPNLIKSSRNIPEINTTNVNVINMLDIMSHKTLLMTEAAVRIAEKLWGDGSTQGGRLMHLYEVLRRPLITEKSTALQALNKYAFEIADGANKIMIKQAVEKAFKVSVTGVNVVTMHGKTRHMGRREIQTNPWKKAIVTLKPGDKIEFFEGV